MVRQVIKFQATDGNVFDTERDANIHDIKLKFEEVFKDERNWRSLKPTWNSIEVMSWIFRNHKKLQPILNELHKHDQ